MSDVTRLIDAAVAGDRKAALLPLVHDELRRLAAARMPFAAGIPPCRPRRAAETR